MQVYNNTGNAVAGYHAALADGVAVALKFLLENKHLYQNLTIDSNAIRERFLRLVEKDVREQAEKRAHFGLDAGSVPWILKSDGARVSEYLKSNMTAQGRTRIIFNPPDLKLYCSRLCNRHEAFNLVSATLIAETDPEKRYQPVEEIYALTYRCQSCKSMPDAFMVRRQGAKLQLAGRVPIEHVHVPDFIPKDIAKYYSGALIAFQSGQSLAANFMLRTACEQWARKWAEPTDRADAALEKYMASLPAPFKEQFPSLSDIYSQLSADIHAATGSEELFKAMQAKFDEHFDARRLYKLQPPEAPTPPAVPTQTGAK